MSNESSKIADYINENDPWCPNCRAHRKISVKGGKSLCATCGEAELFNPLVKKFSSIALAVISIFFLLGATVWGVTSFLLSLVCAWFAWKFFSQHQNWVKWAEKTRDRERRSSRKTRDRELRERRKQSKKKKRGEAEKAPPLAPPPRAKPPSPVPQPPPLPPDADDED